VFEIASQEFSSINKNGEAEALHWNLNTNETMARWNRSIEEPEIHVQFLRPGYTDILCSLGFTDCTGEFRLYYSNNEENYTVEVNFPVINHTIPGEGGGGDGGIGDTVSDALPGFGLVAGIGALALAAVGASRFTREE
jgi:hypothetical protein